MVTIHYVFESILRSRRMKVPEFCYCLSALTELSSSVYMQIVPQIPLLDEDVARLQKALLEAHREAEALSDALESPAGNAARCRMLDGKIPGELQGGS